METASALSRTQEEIVERLQARKPTDPLGFEVHEYLLYLDFDHARQFLKEGVSCEEWEGGEPVAPPLERMRGYMPFAFGKAFDCRGISSNRSIQHCIAWIWLNGESDFCAKVDNEYQRNYHGYGVDILRTICEHYGWDANEMGDLGGYPHE